MRALLTAAAALLLLATFAPMASARDPCGDTYTNGSVRTETTEDCQVVVSVKAYDCVWGGHWETTKVGPVTYRSYSCDPYPPA